MRCCARSPPRSSKACRICHALVKPARTVIALGEHSEDIVPEMERLASVSGHGGGGDCPPVPLPARSRAAGPGGPAGHGTHRGKLRHRPERGHAVRRLRSGGPGQAPDRAGAHGDGFSRRAAAESQGAVRDGHPRAPGRVRGPGLRPWQGRCRRPDARRDRGLTGGAPDQADVGDRRLRRGGRARREPSCPASGAATASRHAPGTSCRRGWRS